MIVCPTCASSHDVAQALLSVVIVRDRACHPIPRFTRIFHSTSHSFELLLMSRLIHLRLQTQLMWQGFVCIVASAAWLLSSATRLGGTAQQLGDSAARLSGATRRRGASARNARRLCSAAMNSENRSLVSPTMCLVAQCLGAVSCRPLQQDRHMRLSSLLSD